MKTYKEFLEEARRPRMDVKNGHVGNLMLSSGLHKHIGGDLPSFEKHLSDHKKKYGYERVTAEHGGHDTDKYRERAAGSLSPAMEHSKYTMHHKDGSKEHMFVDHSHGKIYRIGHHTTTEPGKHNIHVTGKSVTYKNGNKIKTGWHHDGYTSFEHHD